tara:strand:- start:2819 stop:3043 length:225 start_codon:yes stop_codon:yes gene_type:complete
MQDPNAGRFDLQEAEKMLGIGEEERRLVRLIVSVDMLLAHVGITADQIGNAYSERVRNDLLDAVSSLKTVAGDE